MSDRNKLGQFKKSTNWFKVQDELVYCYDKNQNLLFFTDDKKVLLHSWGKLANGYSATSIDGKEIAAHRFVSQPKKHELVDHINRDKKDNRKCNLRNTNKSVNAFNSKIRADNTSGCKGVHFRNDTKNGRLK